MGAWRPLGLQVSKRAGENTAVRQVPTPPGKPSDSPRRAAAGAQGWVSHDHGWANEVLMTSPTRYLVTTTCTPNTKEAPADHRRRKITNLFLFVCSPGLTREEPVCQSTSARLRSGDTWYIRYLHVLTVCQRCPRSGCHLIRCASGNPFISWFPVRGFVK